MLLLALASILISDPAPLEMPTAEGYLVREGKSTYLEDRFDRLDLWVSQSVDGRWVDEAGRVFLLAHLDSLPPDALAQETTLTRVRAEREKLPIDLRNLKEVRRAVAALVSIPLAEKPSPPRQLPRGFKDVDYWQGTNTSMIVCAFLREDEGVWRLATWTLAEEDDFDECRDVFEDELFDHPKEFGLDTLFARLPSYPAKRLGKRKKSSPLSERDLLRRDARHSVAAYEDWHVAEAKEFSVLDELPNHRTFLDSLTNELTVMRAKYAAALPTAVDVSNVLCVARVFASRADYLDALSLTGLTNMTWSAAYWCPSRRELVAYLPSEGEERLLKTFRHEAFHQYLSYATSLLPVSPWLNEGYAQYFEEGVVAKDEFLSRFPSEEWKKFAQYLPRLLMMDLAEFYSGSDDVRQLNYRLAYTIAGFLEEGASKVRFQPFATLKADYLAALVETQDMRKATARAFKSEENLKLFVSEWLKFWKEK